MQQLHHLTSFPFPPSPSGVGSQHRRYGDAQTTAAPTYPSGPVKPFLVATPTYSSLRGAPGTPNGNLPVQNTALAPAPAALPPPQAIILVGGADLATNLSTSPASLRSSRKELPTPGTPPQYTAPSAPARSPPSRRSFWLEALTWPPPHRRASPRCGHPRRRCDPGSTPSMYLAPVVRGHIIQQPPTHNAAAPAIAHIAGSSRATASPQLRRPARDTRLKRQACDSDRREAIPRVPLHREHRILPLPPP
jgi:hypothetical protein